MKFSQRNTYLVRIKELQRLGIPSQQHHEKALPERPVSDESLSYGTFQPLEGEDEDMAAMETATARRVVDNSFQATEATSSQLPAGRQSLLPSAFEEGPQTTTSETGSNQLHDRSLSDLTRPERGSDLSLNRAPADGDDDILPLSPRRPFTPDFSNPQSDSSHLSPHTAHQPLYSMPHQRTHEPGNESTSWLDTIDESGASSPASVQSNLSTYSHQGHSRRVSTGTEAEFDAALDAAVEAAYDEGLEPAMDASDGYFGDDAVSNARRNIEIAKRRVREAEREAQVVMARGREQRRIQERTTAGQTDGTDSDYVDEEAEEEERLLEEMTKGYVMDDFEFDLHSKSALPRQSDSSGFSGRTWGSSVASNTTTAGTSLSTLAEGVALDAKMQHKRLPPPPRISSSGPPAQPAQSRPLTPSSSLSPTTGAGVRARRLSGQNLKQLKIETNRMPSGSQAPATEPSSIPVASPPPPLPQDEPKTSLPIHSSSTHDFASRSAQQRTSERKASIDSFAGDLYGTGLGRVVTHDSEDLGRSNAPSPSRPIGKVTSAPGNLRKNTSSSSLRALRGRNMSMSTPDISADSPNTPSSTTFPNLDFQKGIAGGSIPTLPTPTGATFTANGLPTGVLYLFDSNIHSPDTPGSPNSTAANAPIPLEPCPESFLLRPFWLMRCLYQTIAHPRGGYLSTKLFVPRDVWRVKNVKIKAVEDKVSLCDLLTAALLKLAQVDTYDADAVLEEMQAFENILDQVQSSLAKKLGSEVGVQGSLSLFKSASTSEDATSTTEGSSLKTSNGTGKSYLSSWRKLRSKSSAAAHSNAPLSGARENGKDNLTMNSLPMTATPSSRVAKRNVTQLQFTGPNANYMGALARLFDAVQVLGEFFFSVLFYRPCTNPVRPNCSTSGRSRS